ncbi:hypothetical protein NDU88_002270 [Pleurodeles waltl]|uniref:Uncharacterized protein n=1 Tax=Pleurodeles waltl TaxID=8319 RepID=A0AAV7RCV5_PLEWA|nr:hypothetical protein NDU88_002270 [Pleurodeles waltl]
MEWTATRRRSHVCEGEAESSVTVLRWKLYGKLIRRQYQFVLGFQPASGYMQDLAQLMQMHIRRKDVQYFIHGVFRLCQI